MFKHFGYFVFYYDVKAKSVTACKSKDWRSISSQTFQYYWLGQQFVFGKRSMNLLLDRYTSYNKEIEEMCRESANKLVSLMKMFDPPKMDKTKNLMN